MFGLPPFVFLSLLAAACGLLAIWCYVGWYYARKYANDILRIAEQRDQYSQRVIDHLIEHGLTDAPQ